MAQKRAVSIDAVTFDYKLYVSELNAPDNILSEVNISESGMHIVWQSEIQTPYITLVSKEHGWIYQDTKDALLAQYAQLGTTFLLTYDDASTDTVRFAHEKGIVFIPLYEGACIYTAEINLAVIIL